MSYPYLIDFPKKNSYIISPTNHESLVNGFIILLRYLTDNKQFNQICNIINKYTLHYQNKMYSNYSDRKIKIIRLNTITPSIIYRTKIKNIQITLSIDIDPIYICWKLSCKLLTSNIANNYYSVMLQFDFVGHLGLKLLQSLVINKYMLWTLDGNPTINSYYKLRGSVYKKYLFESIHDLKIYLNYVTIKYIKIRCIAQIKPIKFISNQKTNKTE